MNTRGQELSVLVNRIQEGERQKLLHVAALHLDHLQDSPSLSHPLREITGGGKTERQVTYLDARVREIETEISEAIDEIVCIKGDLIEEGEEGGGIDRTN
jgi:hypothetical protein